ncbi:MAG: hypothetical protein IJC20_03665, partial [Clostridia bacterium]|nr:hypothetical protein [Clostridia bacterium]
MERVQQEYEQAIKDSDYLGSLYESLVGSAGLSEDIEKEYGSYISSNTLPLTEYKKQLQDTIDSGGDIGSEIAEAILGAKLLPENTGESLGFMFNMGSDKFNAAHMNQQEKDLYFSIMMKDGPEAADRFYKKIESRLKDRRTNEYNEIVTEIAKDANGWERAALTGGEIATVTFSPFALGAKYLEVLRGETNGVSRLFDTPEIATNAIASDIAKDSKFKSWAYQLGISGGKALMSMGVSGGNGDGVKLLMGSDAATSAMNEAKNRGLTPAQTIAYGTTIGVIEGVTESIGLEAFFGDPTNILAYILKNAASEGTEEVVSELLGNLADVVINTDDAKYKIVYEQYKAKGMTDGEAYLQIAKELAGDVASSFAGGALLGGGFGGMGVGINAVQNVAEQHEADVETGNALLNGENAEDNINTLITEAKTSENKKLVKAAQKVENSKVDFGELGTRYDASARDTGKLMRLSEQQRQKNLIKAATLTDEQKNGYIKRLVSSGMSERDAKKAVKTLTEDAVSGEISAQTVQLVSSNNEARPIYEEISEYLSDEPMQKRITEVAEASPVTKITEELAKPNVESSQELADMLGITDEGTIDDPVSILGKNKNGQLIIKTASGTETVYNEKAESLSGIARIKMNVASTYDISGANAYYTLAPDDIGSLKRFNTVFDEQYTRGNKGGEFVYINNGVSSEIQRAAYNAGKADLENAATRSRTYYASSSENTAKIKAVDVNRGKV